MNIRDMREGDVCAVKDLVCSLSGFYLEDEGAELPEWFETTLAESAFFRRFADSEYSNYVCEIEGTIVGYISMKNENHLFHLFVSECYQGKGISRLLWEHVLAQSACQKYTLRSSLFAVPVYRKFGFVDIGSPQSKDGIGFQAMELCCKSVG